MVLQLSRLIQPRRPLFWLMVVLNLLTTAIVWVLQVYPVTAALHWLLALFALGNAALGMVIAARLMTERAPER